MKFFVDENVPKIVSEYLISLNHDVIDIRGTNKEGIDDFSIFQLSQDNKAIFVSTDRDFFHTIPFKFVNHSGVIIISLIQPNKNAILEKIKWIMESSKIKSFENKILLLRDNSFLIK